MGEPLDKRLDDFAKAVGGQIKSQKAVIDGLAQRVQSQEQIIDKMRIDNTTVLAKIIPVMASAHEIIIKNSFGE